MAYKGSIAAQVTISDAIFAPISGVTMSVGSHVLTPSGPTGTPANQWTTLIDFTAYMPPLDGEQLFAVTATNSNGTKTSASVRFVIDNQGPSIGMTVPAVGTIIGSITTIAAVVTDPSSVLDSSVVAVVAHGDETFTVKLDPDPTMAGRYSHQFDTRLFNIHDLYPTVSFRASDLLGNESSIGYTVALDNTPPLADLDPSSHFRVRVKTAGIWSCSWEFDPLGSDAVDDGEKTAQIFDVRARVEDRGNTPFSGGADIIPISLVDPGRVELLVLDDTTQPLVVDSDGDGVCDKINPLLVPTTTPMSSKDALLVNLIPIASTGHADLTGDPSILNDPTLPCVPGTRRRAPGSAVLHDGSDHGDPLHQRQPSRRSGRWRRWCRAGCSAWATSSTRSPTTCTTAGRAWRCAPPTSSATCRSRACCASASTTTASATSARTSRSSASPTRRR